MANKALSKSSSSLATREIKIKRTMRYCLAPVRMAKINKITDCIMARLQRKRSFTVAGKAHWKSVWRILKNVFKVNPPCDSATPPLGIYPKDLRFHCRDTCSVIFTYWFPSQNNQEMETTQMPSTDK